MIRPCMKGPSRSLGLPALSLALGCGGSGQSLNQTSITCPAGRTLLDGVCVAEAVADYVACVRAQGAQLGGSKGERISADVGYLGVKAGAASEVSERLEKKYAVADAATLEIIRSCGGTSRVGGTAPAPQPASPPGVAGSPGGISWEDMKGAFNPTDAVFVSPAAGGDVYVCRADFGRDGWHAGKTFPTIWPRCSGEWGGKVFLKPGQLLRAHGVRVDWAPPGEFPTSGVRAGTDGAGNAVFVCRGKPGDGQDGWHAGKAWRDNGTSCSMEWANQTANPPGQILYVP